MERFNPRNDKIPQDLFLAERKEVLASWPTGARVDLEEAIAYHQEMPESHNAARLLAKAGSEGTTLVGARAGVGTVEDQIATVQWLEREGYVDILPASVDSFTRSNQYARADEGVRESRKAGRSMLNGFPVVGHGVEGCRRVTEAVEGPSLYRSQAADDRLVSEVALAGGYSGASSNCLAFYGAYSKSDPLDRVIRNYQYCYRLSGYYEEKGVPIYREQQSLIMRAVLIPPSLYNAFSIIISLLMAGQGVKHMGPCSPIQGHLVQDIAEAHALLALTREYLDRLGFGDVVLHRVMNPWAGAYPHDEALAFGVIAQSATTAALAGATLVYCKGTEEALGVVSRENNAAGARAMKAAIGLVNGQRWPQDAHYCLERGMIEQETRAIMNRTLEMGDGDAALATARALETGVLDVPFSPNQAIADKVLGARDVTGAIRYVEVGNLPFGPEIVEFNRERMAERGRAEGREPGYQMVVDDINQAALVRPQRRYSHVMEHEKRKASHG